MRRAVLRGLLVALLAPMSVGCVSYGAYRGLEDELERTKAANRHLVDQYNRAVLEAKLANEGRTVDSTDPDELDRVRAENAALRDQLQREVAGRAKFDNEDIGNVPGSKSTPDGGLSLGASLLFNSGEAALKGKQLPVLDQVAQILMSKYRGQVVILRGHTDSDPLLKTKALYQYNLNLAYQRAYHVFKYMREKHGISESRFRIEAFGASSPVSIENANTKEGKSENRRVVFMLGTSKF